MGQKRRGGVKRSRKEELTKKINTLNSKILSLKSKIRDTPNPEDKDEMEFTIDHLLRKINTIKKTLSRRRTARKKKTKKRRRKKKK